MSGQVNTKQENVVRWGKRGSMKLVVLGATGSTGLEIVRQTIEHGHSVTAFVRSPERLTPFRDRISVKQGNLLDPAELEPVISGHDAVLSAFGPRVPISKADANLLRQFAIALTSAMPRAGVRRVVAESVAFLFKDAIIPPAYLLGRLFFPGVVTDAAAMEKVLEKSGLDWTIARPPKLTPQALHREISRARGAPASFRFQYLLRGRGRFYDQSRSEPLSNRQGRRGLQLIGRLEDCIGRSDKRKQGTRNDRSHRKAHEPREAVNRRFRKRFQLGIPPAVT